MCVLCLYGRRGSFTGVWAHSPALGDSQDLSEAGSPAARGGRLWRASHHLIITAAPWKRSRTEIGQIWKGWDATTIFSKSYKAEGSPHADFSLSISSVPPGVPEAELPNGSRREQHALKTLKKKVSPSADLKFHFRQLHKKKKNNTGLTTSVFRISTQHNDPPKRCHIQDLLWVLTVFQLPRAWQHCQTFSVFVWIEAVWIL